MWYDLSHRKTGIFPPYKYKINKFTLVPLLFFFFYFFSSLAAKCGCILTCKSMCRSCEINICRNWKWSEKMVIAEVYVHNKKKMWYTNMDLQSMYFGFFYSFQTIRTYSFEGNWINKMIYFCFDTRFGNFNLCRNREICLFSYL